MAGMVNLQLAFFASESAVTPLIPALTKNGTTLVDGVFSVVLDLDDDDVADVFADASSPPWIEVKDLTTGKVFSRQRFGVVPFALKVPGQVQKSYVDGHLGGEQFDRSNAASNKVVKWDGDKFVLDDDDLGAPGGGIQSLNGLNPTTQDFAVGQAGSAPGWISAGATHTLNIPNASDVGVAAGLISKAEYDGFNAKVGPGDARLTDARAPTAHAATHRNGGSDEIATAIPAANAIPKAGVGSTLALGWLPATLTGKDADTLDGFDGAALEKVANKGANNGYAGLNGSGQLALSAIPSTLTGKDADTLDGFDGAALEKVANKGANNGYAGLNGTGQLALSVIPTTLTGKDADTVDTFHGSDLEKVANKNQNNGYAGLDGSGRLANSAINWAAPGAIGGTTAAAGSFTTGAFASITTTGSVGIGTTVPGGMLEVRSATAGASGLVLRSSDDDPANPLLAVKNSGGSALLTVTSNAEVIDTPVNFRIGDNSNVGGQVVHGAGIVGLRPSSLDGDRLYITNQGTTVTGGMGGNQGTLRIDRTDGATPTYPIATFSDNGTERMRVTLAGNVGIGTTIPAHALDVVGDVRVSGEVHLGNSGATCAPGLTGSIRHASGNIQHCDGSSWITLLSTAIIRPVGSIMAWHKSFANTPALPSGWVECNGQTLSDAGSPYNGQVIPALNSATQDGSTSSGMFLRGSTTSGTLHADATAQNGLSATTTAHRVTATSALTAPNSGTAYVYGYAASAVTVSSTDTETRPPNMTVVWIMRVK